MKKDELNSLFRKTFIRSCSHPRKSMLKLCGRRCSNCVLNGRDDFQKLVKVVKLNAE